MTNDFDFFMAIPEKDGGARTESTSVAKAGAPQKPSLVFVAVG
ncbi:MAG: hypothetical protein RMZ41_014880 [Nostoc sp. DedVER02]|nr:MULTISPECIES: hypothetical protein [unclassified Nostoc]MDZ7988324.1 hypothetical protein [Nostoc sp. DedVER02]MDZ8113620.1 hypothetical protein [Nostoc sp. DedVER01b]